MSKKASVADMVKARLQKWEAGEVEQLWQQAVARSSRPLPQEEPKVKSDKERLEARVLSALRLGDVKKALQMLGSPPIAPKTATLERMRKLHPKGSDPSPGPKREVPYFKADVVRSALSSFGPTSAAGMFGYKSFLLQQCMRRSHFTFRQPLPILAITLPQAALPRF